MNLAYYEARLKYDMSRDCSLTDESLGTLDCGGSCERISQSVSSSITHLLLDIAVLFEDDDNGGHNDPDVTQPAFNLLHFTQKLLKSARAELTDCVENMVALADLLQSLNDELTKLDKSSETLIEESERLNLRSCAAIKTSSIWLEGAEAKLKLHSVQLIRETYLSDPSIIPALQVVKDKLNARRAALLVEKEKVSYCHQSIHSNENSDSISFFGIILMIYHPRVFV